MGRQAHINHKLGSPIRTSASEDACLAISIAVAGFVNFVPEVRFSAVGPAIVMPMIIGYKRARELLYFSDQIDAQTALDIGMINRIVPLAELHNASLNYAKRLLLISPEALFATKRAINRVGPAAQLDRIDPPCKQ